MAFDVRVKVQGFRFGKADVKNDGNLLAPTVETTWTRTSDLQTT